MSIATHRRVPCTFPDTEWAPAPPLRPLTSFPQYEGRRGPGFAEIKPHKVDQIRAGLLQLHDSLRDPLYRGAPLNGRTPTRFLITYRYPRPLGTGHGFCLKANVLAPRPDLGRNLVAPGPSLAEQRAWLIRLGDWYDLPEAEEKRPAWLNAARAREAGPTVFGLLVEPHLRKAFLARYQRAGRVAAHLSKGKPGNRKGPDVWWKELAEFLEELSQELRWDGDLR